MAELPSPSTPLAPPPGELSAAQAEADLADKDSEEFQLDPDLDDGGTSDHDMVEFDAEDDLIPVETSADVPRDQVKIVYMARTLPSKHAAGVLRGIKDMRIRLRTRGCEITRLHSDRGSEFIDSRLSDWCLDEAIRLTFTAADEKEPNGTAERGVGICKAEGRVALVASGLDITFWPWAVRHWDDCRWAAAFDFPPPLPFGMEVVVRQKEWKLLNAFAPRMLQGVYLGTEDVQSTCAGHLVLMEDGNVVRATTLHTTGAPMKGAIERAAARGWTCVQNPDKEWYWRHLSGEVRWTDPSMTDCAHLILTRKCSGSTRCQGTQLGRSLISLKRLTSLQGLVHHANASM